MSDEFASLGAWFQGNKVFFRAWGPKCASIEVVLHDEKKTYALQKAANGYFSGVFTGLKPETHYTLRVDGKYDCPDPCSRFQHEGPFGPSMLIDQNSYIWRDAAWQKRGIDLHGQVFYELHVGAFSESGTYAGVMHELRELRAIGITCIELMPIAEFPGERNWGYDGVNLFAPAHVYGRPEELKSLIDACHQLGMGIILDVVYNHLGPSGNYLKFFSDDYFTGKYKNEWGDAINFDGPGSSEVREFFIQNACYWIQEYHFDGLRLDATQTLYDESELHILRDISSRVRKAAGTKKILLIAENEPQNTILLKPVEEGGYGYDAMWNDDFHHSARVCLTGRREGYYHDYCGKAQEFVSLLKQGFLYQGQFYAWQGKARGSPVDASVPAESFVVFLQNHDQVANSLLGSRLTNGSDHGLYRALTTLFLLAPQTPLLFMGQEFGASTPFCFFADHKPELAAMVFKGRREFLAQFPSIASSLEAIDDPKDIGTFLKSKLNFRERVLHAPVYRLHKDLLHMRKDDVVFSAQDRSTLDGAVLADSAFVLRYRGQQEDRLLLLNLGDDLDYSPCTEPLLAPRVGRPWEFLWSSEDLRYSGKGIVRPLKEDRWYLSARSAVVYG